MGTGDAGLARVLVSPTRARSRASSRHRETKALVNLLRDGPQPVPDILKHLRVLHIGQVEAKGLLRQEIIGKAGLTPTDLMHIKGSYASWDVEAAAVALEVFAHNRWREPAEVREQIWRRVGEMAMHAIVTFLSGKRLAAPGASDADRDDGIGSWFFYNSLYHAHPQLDTEFRLRHPIIGIGAPAGLFLKPVAEALHTELILPQHFQVANAVGAIAGTVMVMEEILVLSAPRIARVWRSWDTTARLARSASRFQEESGRRHGARQELEP